MSVLRNTEDLGWRSETLALVWLRKEHHTDAKEHLALEPISRLGEGAWVPGDKEQTVHSHGAKASDTISSAGTRLSIAGQGLRAGGDPGGCSGLGDISWEGQVASC